MADPDRTPLKVSQRSEQGSRDVRRLRREGAVPGVLYGGGNKESVAFKVGERELRAALAEEGALIDLTVDAEKPRPVIVQDEQRHPVRGNVIHVDLLQVKLDEKISTTVPIELSGVEEAPGVTEGGVLEHITREIEVEALPTDIPDKIVVDCSEMGIAETMTLAGLDKRPGVTFLDDPEETVIATITAPTELEEPEEVEEETELVGEDGEPIEGEEGEVPEGEEAPAAEGGEGGEGREGGEGGKRGEGGGKPSSGESQG